MTAMSSHVGHRRLDVASLALMLISLVSGVLSLVFVTHGALGALVIIPSVIACVTGATHITKREAPRL